jgi:hypothetical protein
VTIASLGALVGVVILVDGSLHFRPTVIGALGRVVNIGERAFAA